MMKMQIKGLLPALFVFAGLSQAETVTYWDGGNTMSGLSADNGTWTIGVNLNAKKFQEIVSTANKPSEGNFWENPYDSSGNVLFAIQGSGTSKEGFENSRGEYNDRSTYVTMGWGGEWFEGLSNGVGTGLQLGVASTAEGAKDLGGTGRNQTYRVDMKKQNTDNWTINESSREATAMTLDEIATLSAISTARMDIVHSFGSDNNITNDGEYMEQVVYTSFYLTVTGIKDGNEVTLRYMGQFDDNSTLKVDIPVIGNFTVGSGGFDVDDVTTLTGINTNLIDSMYFSDVALNESDRNLRAEGVIPEPTTATMSLLALAALVARRRRK
ncbi:MAG: PEP-CTERM sorting domain-containing protein [Akkermansia sp.]|nr:PEP-CTERM sorting domain-containing protein [Akkermansia sp.]